MTVPVAGADFFVGYGSGMLLFWLAGSHGITALVQSAPARVSRQSALAVAASLTAINYAVVLRLIDNLCSSMILPSSLMDWPPIALDSENRIIHTGSKHWK
jgi:hypothetical protein